MRGKGKEIMLDRSAGVTLLGQCKEQKKPGFPWWLYALTPRVLSNPRPGLQACTVQQTFREHLICPGSLQKLLDACFGLAKTTSGAAAGGDLREEARRKGLTCFSRYIASTLLGIWGLLHPGS